MQEVVSDYMAATKPAAPTTPPPAMPGTAPVEAAQAAQPMPETENEVVDTSTGITGKVKAKGKTQAILDADGQLHKAETDDLTHIPPELTNLDWKDFARAFKERFPKTGAGSISTNVSLVSHRPTKNEMLGSFVTAPGFLYIYQNITPEIYDKIKSQSVAPRTSGTGFLGEWDPAMADSIGSPMFEITSHPEKYPFEKIPVGYDMLALLKQAISELEKEHAKAERARKKAQGK
jgi:hypothetical protein